MKTEVQKVVRELFSFSGKFNRIQFIFVFAKFVIIFTLVEMLGVIDYLGYHHWLTVAIGLGLILFPPAVYKRIKDIGDFQPRLCTAISIIYVLTAAIPVVHLLCFAILLLVPSGALANRSHFRSPDEVQQTAQPASSLQSKSAQISELLDLKERGGLTEEEFNREKAKILSAPVPSA